DVLGRGEQPSRRVELEQQRRGSVRLALRDRLLEVVRRGRIDRADDARDVDVGGERGAGDEQELRAEPGTQRDAGATHRRDARSARTRSSSRDATSLFGSGGKLSTSPLGHTNETALVSASKPVPSREMSLATIRSQPLRSSFRRADAITSWLSA